MAIYYCAFCSQAYDDDTNPCVEFEDEDGDISIACFDCSIDKLTEADE